MPAARTGPGRRKRGGAPASEPDGLAPGVLAGDSLSVARAISLVEDRAPEGAALLQSIASAAGRAHRVGVTGPPGAGKSTLVNALAKVILDRGGSIGILAVDPTSPFTGGALLGDRVRMQGAAGDPRVFIRSMASRGGLGGLAAAAQDAADVLDAAGKAWVVMETVGVGQTEVEVAGAADTVVVLLHPEAGDGVQAMKAGLMEVADIFVVNKADREGADRVARDLTMMLGLREAHGDLDPEILKLSASTGQGVPELVAALARHGDRLSAGGGQGLAERRRRQAEARLRLLLLDRTRRQAEQALARLGGLEALATEVASRRLDPYAA
ncbi:MAG TPA: methylmalonyl Co-A mutase-associated GTPase MeaB, partial [Planctomycetota bacterium]|nr:methylmalonyl Co-A mutase-associated GTPase MeaB [Planctomycetota bacterium]